MSYYVHWHHAFSLPVCAASLPGESSTRGGNDDARGVRSTEARLQDGAQRGERGGYKEEERPHGRAAVASGRAVREKRPKFKFDVRVARYRNRLGLFQNTEACLDSALFERALSYNESESARGRGPHGERRR